MKILKFIPVLLLIMGCENKINSDTKMKEEAKEIETLGTVKNPIIDSQLTWYEAMKNLSPECPVEVKNNQVLITVLYYSFDQKIHRGQVLIHRDLAEDLRKVFNKILEVKFPIASVIPVSQFQWDDNLSMSANNSSAFNYRTVPGKSSLSHHAFGQAIDINPVQNPYIIKKDLIMPEGAIYQKEKPGTFSKETSIVKYFKSLGWIWGGNWTSIKDYQHFEKVF